MRMIVLAGCAAMALLGWSPDEAQAQHHRHRQHRSHSHHGHHGGRLHVDVHVGGYHGGPVICLPPRPVYRHVQTYCPPPVQYCPPPVVYRHRPVYHSRPVYTGHYQSGYSGGYRSGYSRHCDW